MTQPPAELDGAKVLFYATLQADHRPTGNTKHYVGGGWLRPASGLAICQYENGEGFYLFYCDSEWKVTTDTYQESIEDAKNQAEFEYEGVGNAWKQISMEGAV
jgi:hypothetical protein